MVASGGHLRAAPELVVEVLSRGAANDRRDREEQLALYERQGVRESWIVDWRRQRLDVYRRGEVRREGPRGRHRGEARRDGPGGSHRADGDLPLATTLTGEEVLTTPLLPEFVCPLPSLWAPPA